MTRRPVLLIATALVALHVDVLLMGHTVLPLMQPSVTATGVVGYDGFQTERYTSIDPGGGFDAEYAWAAYFVASVRRWGVLPLWNPYQGLGQPQLANYVSAVLYPINWLTLLLPSAWWDLVGFLDWFLAAYFTYLLGRVLRVTYIGALAGALALLAAGFFAGFVAVRSIIGTVPWFPFLLYAIERTLRQPDWKWSIPAIGLGTFGLATGGHPEPALTGLVLVLLYLAARVAAAWRARAAVGLRIAAAMIFGGLLAAPLLVPFAHYVFLDAAMVHGAGFGAAFFPRAGLALTVFPYVFGPLNDDLWRGTASTMAWMPAGVTFLSVAGAIGAAKARRGGLVALALVAALAAAKLYGVPIVNDVGRLPPLQKFWFQYMSGFVAVALCVLAGAGVEYLWREPARRWRAVSIGWVLYAGAMLGLAVVTATHVHAARLAQEPWRADFLSLTIACGTFWAVAYPAALFAARARRPHASGPFVLIVTAGLLLQALACFPNGSPRSFVLFNAAAAGAFCVVAAGALWMPPLRRRRSAAAVAVAVTAVVAAACAWTLPRLPRRADPLTRAPYVRWLAARPNAPRVYPLDSILYPDFAAAFQLASLTNLENLVPKPAASFYSLYLDAHGHPARFSSYREWQAEPLSAFWRNKRHWDLAGARYVLTSTRAGVNSRLVFDTRSPFRSLDPVVLGPPLEAALSCDTGSFDALSIIFSTFGTKQEGDVTVDVMDGAGRTLASVSEDSYKFVDNAAQYFELPVRVCTNPADEVLLRLRFRPAVPGAMLGMWRYPDGFLFQTREKEAPAAGLLRPVYDDLVTGVRIWENPTAADRAFLAPRVEVVASDRQALAKIATADDLQGRVFIEQPVCAGSPSFAGAEPGRLAALHVSPNRVAIVYDARATGVLTLTDVYTDGWRATVDGRDAPVLRVDGVFRGVCLDAPGRHRIEFTYRPPLWNLALALAGVGAIGLVLGFCGSAVLRFARATPELRSRILPASPPSYRSRLAARAAPRTDRTRR